MRRMVLIALSLMVGLVGSTSAALAGDHTKEANVTLYVNGALPGTAVVEVFEGDDIDLSAVTVKQGSSMADSWTGTGVTQVGTTTLNTATGSYESAAVLDTSEAGEYEIEYSAIMAAGKSGVQFVGGKKTTVTVVESSVTVKKITVRVLSVTARTASGTGAVTGYNATADGVAEFSDGSTVQIDEFSFNYNKWENDAKVEVTVVVNGEELTFDLEIPFVDASEEVVFDDPVAN